MKTKFNVIAGTIRDINVQLTEFLLANRDKKFTMSTMCGNGPQFCMYIFWEEEDKKEPKAKKDADNKTGSEFARLDKRIGSTTED